MSTSPVELSLSQSLAEELHDSAAAAAVATQNSFAKLLPSFDHQQHYSTAEGQSKSSRSGTYIALIWVMLYFVSSSSGIINIDLYFLSFIL